VRSEQQSCEQSRPKAVFDIDSKAGCEFHRNRENEKTIRRVNEKVNEAKGLRIGARRGIVHPIRKDK